jgi:arginine exporter protein ArgO
MIKTIMKYLNDNHWYIIAAIVICAIFLWLFGCQSKVSSMITPEKQITRDELMLESDYLLGEIKVKLADLDKQDEIKQLIIDQASMFSKTGSFNPMGLLNTLISVGAISFGLNRNQKLNAYKKDQPAAAA